MVGSMLFSMEGKLIIVCSKFAKTESNMVSTPAGLFEIAAAASRLKRFLGKQTYFQWKHFW